MLQVILWVALSIFSHFRCAWTLFTQSTRKRSMVLAWRIIGLGSFLLCFVRRVPDFYLLIFLDIPEVHFWTKAVACFFFFFFLKVHILHHIPVLGFIQLRFYSFPRGNWSSCRILDSLYLINEAVYIYGEIWWEYREEITLLHHHFVSFHLC